MNTGTWGDFPFLICFIYGPPDGCGALTSHAIPLRLKQVLGPSGVKHMPSVVIVQFILQSIFTS